METGQKIFIAFVAILCLASLIISIRNDKIREEMYKQMDCVKLEKGVYCQESLIR